MTFDSVQDISASTNIETQNTYAPVFMRTPEKQAEFKKYQDMIEKLMIPIRGFIISNEMTYAGRSKPLCL